MCVYVQVKANNGASEQVWVKPVTLGQVPVVVKAQSVAAADAMQQMLLVEVRKCCCFFLTGVCLILEFVIDMTGSCSTDMCILSINLALWKFSAFVIVYVSL